MNRILDKFRNARLQVRLSLPVVTALVVLLASQWILYAFLADIIHDNLHSGAETVSTSIRSHMDTRMRSIIERLYYVKLDPSVEENLTDYLLREDRSTEAVTMSRLSYALPLYKATEPLISSLLIYTPKYTFTGEGTPMRPDFRFEDTSLWQALRSQPGDIVFASPGQDEIFRMTRNVVPVMHRFRIEGYGPDCVLVANIDLEDLTAYLTQALPGDGSTVMLVTEYGQILARPGHAALQELAQDREALRALLAETEMTDMELAGENYLVGTTALESAPWRIVYLQSEKSSFTLLSWLRLSFSAVALLIISLLLVSLSRIVNTVTEPLGRLCDQIRASESRHRLLDFSYPYQDEIGTLAESYNSMAEHIQQLLEEQDRYIRQLEEEKARADEEQALKRRAELRALQAQINPHFLYNTLDSIRWKAEIAGATDISRMTTALATLFRIGLSRGQEIITVKQEVRHVESYLQIQKMRYSDRMTYSMDIQKDILELYTVKLLLQPLVENAIYHGIKESSHSGTVVITGCREGEELVLRVSDNGMGIPPERLKALQADLAAGLSVSREGYGIFNVNERIRLHFGQRYGLTLESVWGEGTVATVRLPCITMSEVENYVSHYDRG